MSFEALKYPRSREKLQSKKEYIEKLHNSIEFILPPQNVLNSNSNKKFFLKIQKSRGWPNIVIQAEDSKGNREIRLAQNGYNADKKHYSYLLTNKGESLPIDDEFTNFLDEDRDVFDDRCENIRNSLLKADSLGVIDGWDAKPVNGGVRYISHPSLS